MQFSFYHIKILTLSDKDNNNNVLKTFWLVFDLFATSLTLGIPPGSTKFYVIKINSKLKIIKKITSQSPKINLNANTSFRDSAEYNEINKISHDNKIK